MQDHMIEILIILSNLLVALPTIALAFITVFTVEKDRRVEMLMALHIRAREGARRHVLRANRIVRFRRRRTVTEETSD